MKEMKKEWKQIIFDPIFAVDVRHVCLNDTPAGSVPGDFEIAEYLEYCALMYAPEKESQALDILFIAVGRLWCEAKSGYRQKEMIKSHIQAETNPDQIDDTGAG